MTTDGELYEQARETVRTLVREGKFSARTGERFEALGALMRMMAPNVDDATIERAVRDEWLPVHEGEEGSLQRAIGHMLLATVQRRRGDVEAERRSLEAAIPSLRGASDEAHLIQILGRLAELAAKRGDHFEARRIRRDEQLVVAERLGDREVVRVLGEIGRSLREQGLLAEAERLARDELIPAARRGGDGREVVEALIALWSVLQDLGDHEAIVKLAREEILPEAAAADYARGVATGAFAGARALIALHRVGEAIDWLRDVGVPAADQADDLNLRVATRTHLGDVLAVRGDRSGARRVWREALRIAGEAGWSETCAEIRSSLDSVR